MFIQDLTNHALNITAEIPEEEAAAFQKYCLQYFNELSKSGSVAAALVTSPLTPSTTSTIDQNKVEHNNQNIQKKIDDNDCLLLESRILNETADLLARTPSRIKSEEKILSLFKSLLCEFDSKLKLVPIGSSVYGLGGKHTNFNIIINAGRWLMNFVPTGSRLYDLFTLILCLQTNRRNTTRII